MTNGNDPAFYPKAKRSNEPLWRKGWESTCLTKREYFAVMAMQGCLASCPEGMKWQTTNLPFDAWAKSSIAMADALISALNQGAKP